MDTTIIVMIVTLALPSGEESINVKPMANADRCRAEAQIEASDPFVARVVCSTLKNGVLELNFRKS